MTDLAQVFLNPSNSAQRRYEILRACFVDNQPMQAVAQYFGYSYGSVRNLCSEFRRNPYTTFLHARTTWQEERP